MTIEWTQTERRFGDGSALPVLAWRCADLTYSDGAPVRVEAWRVPSINAWFVGDAGGAAEHFNGPAGGFPDEQTLCALGVRRTKHLHLYTLLPATPSGLADDRLLADAATAVAAASALAQRRRAVPALPD